jgi:hypothetical protein
MARLAVRVVVLVAQAHRVLEVPATLHQPALLKETTVALIILLGQLMDVAVGVAQTQLV